MLSFSSLLDSTNLNRSFISIWLLQYSSFHEAELTEYAEKNNDSNNATPLNGLEISKHIDVEGDSKNGATVRNQHRL